MIQRCGETPNQRMAGGFVQRNTPLTRRADLSMDAYISHHSQLLITYMMHAEISLFRMIKVTYGASKKYN